MNSFRTFRCQTVISVVHMDAYMLTLRLQFAVVGSFRLHVMPLHVFETKRNLGNQFFPNLSFCCL